MEGMTYRDVVEMDGKDREWFLTRLHKQLKRESEEIKRSSRGKGR